MDGCLIKSVIHKNLTIFSHKLCLLKIIILVLSLPYGKIAFVAEVRNLGGVR